MPYHVYAQGGEGEPAEQDQDCGDKGEESPDDEQGDERERGHVESLSYIQDEFPVNGVVKGGVLV